MYIMSSQTNFVILPATGSVVSEMFTVLVLFSFYVLYVCYLASYNTGYKPNYVMFINFIFDNYSNSDFKRYINNIVNDSKIEMFTVNDDIKKSYLYEKLSNIFDYLNFILKKMLSKLFIKGNRISIIQND